MNDPPRLLGRHETLSALYPKTAVVIEQLSFAAVWPKDAETRSAIERALEGQAAADVVARVEASYLRNGKTWLGFHMDAFQRPRVAPQVTRPDPEVMLAAYHATNEYRFLHAEVVRLDEELGIRTPPCRCPSCAP
jgi:hypothetical protein